jgi:hypothetical protein
MDYRFYKFADRLKPGKPGQTITLADVATDWTEQRTRSPWDNASMKAFPGFAEDYLAAKRLGFPDHPVVAQPARQFEPDIEADQALHLATLETTPNQPQAAIDEQRARYKAAAAKGYVDTEQRRMNGIPDRQPTADERATREYIRDCTEGLRAWSNTAPDTAHPVKLSVLARIAGCDETTITRGERRRYGWKRLPACEHFTDPPQGGNRKMQWYSLWHCQRVIDIRAKRGDPGPAPLDGWALPEEWIPYLLEG